MTKPHARVADRARDPYSPHMRDEAGAETTLASRNGELQSPGPVSRQFVFTSSPAKAYDRSTLVVMGAAALACATLASCADPIGRAEERRQAVYDQGGTNREVCREARKAKAAYVDAGRHDDTAWLAVEIHCADVDGPSGEQVAKQQSDAVMAGRR